MTYDPFDPFMTVQDCHLRIKDKTNAESVEIIGTIYKPTGKMLTTDEGFVSEMAPELSWRINVRHNKEAPELDIKDQ